MLFTFFSISYAGMPSLKTLTCVLLMMFVSLLLLLPMMSLLSTASIFTFAFRDFVAIKFEPNNPCSSPLTAIKMIVAGKLLLLIILAHSITVAVPLASSFAPGASPVRSMTFVRMLSKWPVMIKMRSSFGSVPFSVATTFPKSNAVSILLLSGCKVVVSIIAESLPPESNAYSLNFFRT